MRLELDSSDLLYEYIDLPTRLVSFVHFKPEVQQAIQVVGKGTYYSNKGTRLENYTVVYPS